MNIELQADDSIRVKTYDQRAFVDLQKLEGAILTKIYPTIHRTVLYRKDSRLYLLTIEESADLSDINYDYLKDAEIIFDSQAKTV